MTNIFDLKSRKTEKLNTKIIADIDKILHILSTSQQALSFFKQYIPVHEIVSVIETNKTLFELHRKKYAEELQKNKE